MYNPIFAKIVFYLDTGVYESFSKAFLDLQNPLNYNHLVYVLMEFRERIKAGKIRVPQSDTTNLYKSIEGERNEKNLSAKEEAET